MQVQLTDGYVSSYAFEGNLTDGIKVNEPDNISHFEECFEAYRIRDGTLVFDEEKQTANERKALQSTLRQRRETECFSYINRGRLWYDRLTEAQTSELNAWYTDWLKVTDTLTVPQRPSWLY